MNHPKNLVAAAKHIIATIPYITIATVSEDGAPWNTPVFCAYDSNFNFYFSTDTQSHKAKNIHTHSTVFVVIYDSTAQPGTGIGVYIEGSAKLLVDEEDKREAYELLSYRRQPVPFHDYESYENGPYGLYRITPKRVYMNTESSRDGYYVDKKVEITLS